MVFWKHCRNSMTPWTHPPPKLSRCCKTFCCLALPAPAPLTKQPKCCYPRNFTTSLHSIKESLRIKLQNVWVKSIWLKHCRKTSPKPCASRPLQATDCFVDRWPRQNNFTLETSHLPPPTRVYVLRELCLGTGYERCEPTPIFVRLSVYAT